VPWYVKELLHSCAVRRQKLIEQSYGGTGIAAKIFIPDPKRPASPSFRLAKSVIDQGMDPTDLSNDLGMRRLIDEFLGSRGLD
jgi:hypothetical protein